MMHRFQVVFSIGLLAAIPYAALTAQELEEDLPLYLFADLSGKNETKGGDADGYGDFAGVLKFKEGQFCWELSVGQITNVTAAHIHAGKAGADGEPVITIGVTGMGKETCVAADVKLMRQIADAPGEYYVNVHTSAKPAGAVRGQLQS